MVITPPPAIAERFRDLFASRPDWQRRLLQTVAGRLLRRIADRTPVETGEARNSFRELATLADRSGGRGVFGSVMVTDRDPVTEMVVIDDVEHIGPLEYGGRNREPVAMVRRTLADADAVMHGEPLPSPFER